MEHTGKISDTLLQRLALKPAKLEQLAAGIRAIAAMEEPVGRLISKTEVSAGEKGVCGRGGGAAAGADQLLTLPGNARVRDECSASSAAGAA